MPDTNDVRRRTAHRRTTTPGPDDITTIHLPGGPTITVDMVDQAVTLEGPNAGPWTVTDQRTKTRRGK